MTDSSKKKFPIGCVLSGGCLGLLVVGGCFVALIMGLVFGVLGKSAVVREAVAKAQASEDLKAKLGEPMVQGYFVTGNISTQNSTGTADVSIPISGPRGSASLRAVATLENGRWTYSVLEADVAGESHPVPLGGE